jgi:hypothetical protein
VLYLTTLFKYIASYGRMTGSEKMWKIMVVVHFRVLSLYFPSESEKTMKNLCQSLGRDLNMGPSKYKAGEIPNIEAECLALLLYTR